VLPNCNGGMTSEDGEREKMALSRIIKGHNQKKVPSPELSRPPSSKIKQTHNYLSPSSRTWRCKLSLLVEGHFAHPGYVILCPLAVDYLCQSFLIELPLAECWQLDYLSSSSRPKTGH